MDHLSLVQRIVVWILPVVFAITAHEAAHGWAAKRRGDNTAFLLGRLTLNPLKHIDWLGTVILPCLLLVTGSGFIFGWAKPVPVDTRNFKRPLQDMAFVALAGPLSNLLMALAWALLARVGVMIGVEAVSLPLIYSGVAGITINLVLFLINLLPIPPLDGSRVLTGLLPARMAWQFAKIEPYGFYILLALLYFNVLNVVLAYPMYVAQKMLMSLAGL